MGIFNYILIFCIKFLIKKSQYFWISQLNRQHVHPTSRDSIFASNYTNITNSPWFLYNLLPKVKTYSNLIMQWTILMNLQ